MSRSKRLSACQALSLLNQLADNESGDSDDDGEVEGDSSSDVDWNDGISVASDEEADRQDNNSEVVDDTAPKTAAIFQNGAGVETDTKQGGVANDADDEDEGEDEETDDDITYEIN